MTVELPESLINGRFKYSERPMADPGKCAVCGAVDRPVVDFDMTVDYYGAVLLCVQCLKAALALVSRYEPQTNDVETQVAPLLFIDQEGINEYVHTALDSVSRLNTILALNFVSPLVEETTAEPNDVHESAEPTDSGLIKQGDHILIDEGPLSLSGSTSNEPFPGLNI